MKQDDIGYLEKMANSINVIRNKLGLISKEVESSSQGVEIIFCSHREAQTCALYHIGYLLIAFKYLLFCS